MNHAFRGMLCRLLAVLLLVSPWQFAAAGVLGTEQALAPGAAQAERGQLVQELVRFGVEPDVAHARVAAMSDEEARALAGQIAAQPAGGVYTGYLVLAIIIAVIYAWYKHHYPY